MDNISTLQNIIGFVIDNIKKQDYLVYFRKISIIQITKDKVIFGVVSSFMRDNVEAKFTDVLLQAAKNSVTNEIKSIKIVVDENIDSDQHEAVLDCSAFYKQYKKIQKKKESKKSLVEKSVKVTSMGEERYTLQNFIVGGDNQLAYSASEAVSRNPGRSYNPLYIYGDVGLGKTHLLQATGNEINSKFKGKKVVYTTADRFITEYVTSVKKRSIQKMIERFRAVDVLIIDDVQFLAGKEQTQNELYNIFNILYEQDKQIIISGDRAPKELTELEPRLRSRFEWGITVDIGKPDYETRLAIIQEKARSRGFLIPQNVSEFIAANVTDNVRELEGVLNQLIAEYELTGKMPTLVSISHKLKKLSYTDDAVGSTKLESIKKRTTIKSYEDILDAVSKHFGIEKEGILGENRKKEFMLPRQVSMYLLKTKMHYTYERIGNIFSGRNHASVLYSCKKMEKILKKDKNLLQDLTIIQDGIGI